MLCGVVTGGGARTATAIAGAEEAATELIIPKRAFRRLFTFAGAQTAAEARTARTGPFHAAWRAMVQRMAGYLGDDRSRRRLAAYWRELNGGEDVRQQSPDRRCRTIALPKGLPAAQPAPTWPWGEEEEEEAEEEEE